MEVPPFHESIAFNAHHAPMGAFFSFTVGHFATRGGLGLQLGKPANYDIFIGIKDGPRRSNAPIKCLPFFEGAQAHDGAEANFTPEAAPAPAAAAITCYNAGEITRHYGWATDTWKTPDFIFTVFTPFGEIPDPATATPAQLKSALLPAVTAELTLDNSKATQIKTVFFAVNFNEPGARLLDEGLSKNRPGFALRAHLGVAAEIADSDQRPVPFMRWGLADGLAETVPHLLGQTPGLAIEIPPGKCVTLRLAIGCYLGGIVTTRLEGRYLYTRYFSNLQDVLNTALDQFPQSKILCDQLDQQLLAGGGSGLNRDQQFLLAHATRSYYGCTQLLEIEGQPYWIVNEGEYCMMNTLDLSVDHMFWELRHNPWVVRNLLDNFVKHYSYHDQVKLPEPPIENQKSEIENPLAPGGISFAHDQGVHNQFSPFGTSSYELPNLTGCFSYMTQEQLCNWILMAASYVAKTGDIDWARRNDDILDACWRSMLARFGSSTTSNQVHSVYYISYDSDRCGTGQEITSYDSLDASLAQARGNLYIAVKCWASYVGLAYLEALVHKISPRPSSLLPLLANQIAQFTNSDGFLPALLNSADAFHDTRILPAIEGLLCPLMWKKWDKSGSVNWDWCLGVSQSPDKKGNSELFNALRTHTITLLSDQENRNKFPDGGIRLSSTSDNSWASKIAIVQHVARTLWNLDENGQQRPTNTQDSALSTQHFSHAAGWEKSDAAHTRWQTNPASAYWACSDQMIDGIAKGSKYYPRIITAALWLAQ